MGGWTGCLAVWWPMLGDIHIAESSWVGARDKKVLLIIKRSIAQRKEEARTVGEVQREQAYSMKQ